jgi:nicotinamidase-related amidase
MSPYVGKPVLLVVDMQNDFCLPGAPFEVRGALTVVPRIQELLGAFRAHRLPIFFIIREHRADGSDVEITRRDRFLQAGGAFIAGTRGHALVDGLVPRPGELIVKKTRWSPFHKTELESLLRARGVEVVVIAGVQTPNCIRSAAFDANSLDFEVVVSSDATGAGDPDVHRANLDDMAGIGVEIASTGEIIRALPDGLGRGLRARRATTPSSS